MDPILVVLLSIAGVAIAPKLIYNIGAQLIVKSEKARKKRKREKELKKIYNPTKRQQKQKAKAEGLLATKVRVDKFKFRGVKSKTETELTLKEMSYFDPDKDEVLHGILKVVDSSGRTTSEDIYMYQPRVLSANDNLMGPKKENNGSISAKNCYLCRTEGSNEILRGYIPKREILSNLCYDFDVNSPQTFTDRFPDIQTTNQEYQKDVQNIERFIQIQFDKDPAGNFVPVNLRDPLQRQKFQDYVEKHRAHRLQPRDYFLNKIRIAEISYEDYLEKTKPSYAKANIQTNSQKPTLLKVENSKKPETENPYAWYDRFNYYLPSMLGDRVQTGDTIVHGGPGPHPNGSGPRR